MEQGTDPFPALALRQAVDAAILDLTNYITENRFSLSALKEITLALGEAVNAFNDAPRKHLFDIIVVDNTHRVRRKFIVWAKDSQEADQIFEKVHNQEKEAGEPILQDGWAYSTGPVEFELPICEI